MYMGRAGCPRNKIISSIKKVVKKKKIEINRKVRRSSIISYQSCLKAN